MKIGGWTVQSIIGNRITVNFENSGKSDKYWKYGLESEQWKLKN